MFAGVELTYLGANLLKIVEGGWLPLLVALIVVAVMTTWQHGRRIITARRIEVEGPLPEFVAMLNGAHVPRVPGTAVFPHPTKLSTPLALRANVAFNHVLHERVVIVSVLSQNVPHVPLEQRLSIDEWATTATASCTWKPGSGSRTSQDLPEALRQACGLSPELDIDPDEASYFLSRMTIERGHQPGMSAGANGCSSVWPATRPTPQPTSACPSTAR